MSALMALHLSMKKTTWRQHHLLTPVLLGPHQPNIAAVFYIPPINGFRLSLLVERPCWLAFQFGFHMSRTCGRSAKTFYPHRGGRLDDRPQAQQVLHVALGSRERCPRGR